MKTVLLLVATMFLKTVPLAGQVDSPNSRKTLTGLTQFFVLVENLAEDAEHDGLSRTQIQTDVELRLRQAGIPVVDSSRAWDAGYPYLYVSVQTHKSQRGASYAWVLEVHLTQSVALVRNPSIISLAPTWGTGQFGSVGVDKLPSLRDNIRDLVDRFINAFLAENPKK